MYVCIFHLFIYVCIYVIYVCMLFINLCVYVIYVCMNVICACIYVCMLYILYNEYLPFQLFFFCLWVYHI